jgi:uncharacterized membrane protein YhiD involved in acid resistance
MKKLLATLIIISSMNAFAEVRDKIKIKDIKAYLQTVDNDSTCMDEYLKRRKQLILKLSVSPVSMAAGTAASLYAGAATGAGIAYLKGVANEWTGLGYIISGMLLGTAGGAIATTVNTATTGVTLYNIDMILKTLAEQYLDSDGDKSQRLHQKYLKKSNTDLPKDEFIARLMAADANGTLCDGTMVKRPRIRIGSKLKFKVAKLKDLVREL